ncbi:MAG: TonB-dependent receptor [Ferruginibacter sp.]
MKLKLRSNTRLLVCFGARLLFAIFILNPTILFAQNQVTVKGKILDKQNNSPLSDVSVIVRGSGIGTKTGAAGEYSINAKPTDVIEFSSAGFATQQVKVGKQTTIDISLVVSNSNLDEVVVIGYGTAKRKDLTGAISSVSGKDLAAVPVANAAQALQGKLPGVNVTSQDGRPGASVSIRVRGGGSVSQSNEPLYIVDGFPVSSINDVPSSQIQSIDVLKDAASTAIYGARGANGVIIVTTKSGKAGKLSINYDNYVQFNNPTKYLGTLNAYDYIAYNWAYAKSVTNAYASAWEMLWAIGPSAATYNNTEGIDHYKNVAAQDFSKQTYTNSFSQNHNLSISGGNANTKYILSGSYLNDNGMKLNSSFKRANASFKLNQKINSKLNFSFDTRFTNIQTAGSEPTTNGTGSILSSAFRFRPIATKDVLGELDDRVNTQLGLYDIVLQDQYNPVERIKDYLPVSTQRSLRSNASLTWNVVRGLTAKSDFGYNVSWNKSKSWSGAVYNNYINNTGAYTYAGNASLSNGEGWGLRWVNTLNYQVPLGNDNHSLSVVAGQEVNNSYSESNSMFGNRFPVGYTSKTAFGNMDSYFHDPNGVVNSGFSSSIGTPNRLTSYFGRFNYSYMDRFLVSGTFRADGSSRFSPNNRWGYFPAAAVAWRLNNEQFLKDVNWLDNLKLRVSYGAVGNDGISANLWKTQWSTDGLTGYSINEIQQSSYSPASTIANPDLKWETSITKNVGIDFALFNNRITGTIEVYKNTTKDLLLLTSISAISGFSSTYDNIGATSNKGIEISLGGDIIRKRDFNLSANFNINFNRGRVDKLGPNVNGLYRTLWASTTMSPSNGDYVLQVGKPVGQVRGYTYEGWYTVDDFNYAAGIYTLKKGVADIGSGIIGNVFGTNTNKPAGQVAYPGVIKLKDSNGDGIVDNNDVGIIGDMTPKHTGGLSLNSTYKGFDLALNFNWSYGNKIYNANYLSGFYGSKEDGLYRNRFDYLASAYKIYDIQNGQLVSVTDPAALTALNANATTFLPYHETAVVSSIGIQDGSFLRLNTVTLGYSIPSGLIKKAGMSRLRIYASIYNAFTITNYKGLDPEVNTNTGQGGAGYPTIGLDWGSYPRARSYTFGVNVEF